MVLNKRLISLGTPLAVLAYLTYVCFAFDVPSLYERAGLQRGQTLIRDTYSYKTHVTRDNRTARVSVAIEGERKGSYPEGQGPSWVALGDTTVIDLGSGHVVEFGPETVTYDIPGYGRVSARPDTSGVHAELPPGVQPTWISASKNRLAIKTGAGRLTVTRNRSDVFKYALGSELLWFTLDSPYYGTSPT